MAVVNIGGVANITWIGADDEVIAFDTGPGNALMDDWTLQKTGRPMDEGGQLARAGTEVEGALDTLMKNPYFKLPPPKSLDRDDFETAMFEVNGMTTENGAATLMAFTAESILCARHHVPGFPEHWLICGGGRHNTALMERLNWRANAEPVEEVGWDGDMLEAQAFAFLAVRSLKGLPISLPMTTGVPKPLTGGVCFDPQ